MATDYSGDPTATQAPGPTPGFGNYPIVSIPDDGDALNAASVAQAYKELADFLAYTQTYPLVMGSAYVLNEDFDTSALTTKFVLSTGTGAIYDDSVAGAVGCYRLASTTGQSTILHGAANVFANSGNTVTNIRLRSPNGVTTGSSLNIRLTDSASVRWITVAYDKGTNSDKWYVKVDGGTLHDLTVSPSTSTYQLLTIARIDGVLTIYFDGVAKYTQAYTSAIDNGALSFQQVSGTLGNGLLCIDYVKMYVAR